MPARLLTALAIVLALAAPAHADECVVPESSPEVTTPATGASVTAVSAGSGDHPGIYYVDNDPCQPDCLFSTWIYEETNGIEGLQRATIDDWCGAWYADTIIF